MSGGHAMAGEPASVEVEVTDADQFVADIPGVLEVELAGSGQLLLQLEEGLPSWLVS